MCQSMGLSSPAFEKSIPQDPEPFQRDLIWLYFSDTFANSYKLQKEGKTHQTVGPEEKSWTQMSVTMSTRLQSPAVLVF